MMISTNNTVKFNFILVLKEMGGSKDVKVEKYVFSVDKNGMSKVMKLLSGQDDIVEGLINFQTLRVIFTVIYS